MKEKKENQTKKITKENRLVQKSRKNLHPKQKMCIV